MGDGIYAALAGAVAQAQALDVVSNDLANVSTTGFKRSHVTFQESLAQAQGQAPRDPSVRPVVVGDVQADFEPGLSRETGNPFDLSIDGPGFFVVATATGERYTRAGTFRVLGDGSLATQDGDAVLGEGGPIRVDTRRPFRIDERGVISNDERPVDRLRTVAFARPEGLILEGRGLWRAGANAGANAVEPRLRVGAIEQSNVNAVEAMTQIVWISRAYESLHRTIEVYHEVDQKTVNDLGR